MVDLEKYYGELNAFKLIEVIESLKDYKPEVIEFCKKRVSEMNLPRETLKDYATTITKKRFHEYFTKGKYLSNSPIITNSFFLNQKEVKNCFNKTKSEYIQTLNRMTQNLPDG